MKAIWVGESSPIALQVRAMIGKGLLALSSRNDPHNICDD
jgi:hypothetical protein